MTVSEAFTHTGAVLFAVGILLLLVGGAVLDVFEHWFGYILLSVAGLSVIAAVVLFIMGVWTGVA